ncbi:hypothetical protein EIN_223340 [Entamoeba invadens IP1]|uniref:Uncharacterized protein n=1 Tax=Entamoeba invadens IP1 TaxID=370355 RepID=A0A0A1U244_ENTIV|nr:hypothetical protein EIN_223340 [Entamoeba invadens IP1]ELP88141.1 hypothetical protein EIN_223340 [Entamoeba invadens IP1]|eukprot:XP_004254912.1 hypothetical protein EIN_223340 [Entamoeba invadens IP1]
MGFCSNYEVGTYKKTDMTCESCNFATENCNACSPISVGVSNCTTCMANHVLNSGKCQLYPSGKYYNQNSKSCQSNDVNCQIQVDESKCLLCNSNCFLANGGCQQTTRCQNPSNTTMSSCDLRNDIIYKCGDSVYLNISNECVGCVSLPVCQLSKTRIIPLQCQTNYIFDTTTNQCVTDDNCHTVKYRFCTKCTSCLNYISQGRCSKCQTTNCGLCDRSTCMKCLDGFVKYTDTWCVSKSVISTCKTFSSGGCVVCSEGYYQTDAENVEKKYDYRVPIESTTVTNCNRYGAQNTKCVECLDAFKLKGGICAETFDENNKLKTDTKTATETSCQIRNNKKCQHCADGITTSTTSSCKIALPGGSGCAICNSMYYREGISCTPCDESCALCVNSYECLACKDGYFNIPSEGKLCESNTTLANCELSSSSGCERCVSGHFLSNYKCYECSPNCTSCESESVCTICNDLENMLVDSQCLHFTKVELCVSALNSKCVKCEGRRELTDSGDSCTKLVNLGVVIGIPITVLILFVLFITMNILLIIIFLNKRQVEKMKNVRVFDIKKSNITMNPLDKVSCSNKKVLKIDMDSDALIPMDEESCDLICIGNLTKHHLKV